MSGHRPRTQTQIRPLDSLPALESELFTLINLVCDGTASRDTYAGLETILSDPKQPAAIDLYCAAMELHTSLAWRWHAPRGEMEPRTPAAAVGHPRPRASSHDWFAGLTRPATLGIVLPTAALAVAILVAIVGQFWPTTKPVVAGALCGRVIGSRGAVWSAASPAPRPGEQLESGRRFNLGLGLVEIGTDHATIVLEGPATFSFIGPRKISLTRGQLTATVAKPAAAATSGPLFTVQTPTAVVSDLGTQFGVEIDPTGLTTVHVFDGLVECAGTGFAAGSPVRLKGGQKAAVSLAGYVGPATDGAASQRFSRSLALAEEPVWVESRARTMLQDSFGGAGPLAGTSPVSRGGTGDLPWMAPAGAAATGSSWRLSPSGLEIAAPGSATLPFQPQAGRVYRLAVDLTVTAGGTDWAGAGFSGTPTPTNPVLTSAWMFQRHMASGIDPNGFFVGADAASLQFSSGDQKTGRRSFTILLDTRRPRWTVTFAADGQRLRTEPVPASARIESVGLSCHGSCRAVVHSFSLACMEPANGS